MHPSPQRRAVWLAALALMAPMGAARALTFTEVQVTTAAIPDYEFDWARKGSFCASCNFNNGNSRLAFTDKDGNLWVGDVDYQTGKFLPSNGRGILVDTNTAPVPDFGNGPEWMISATYGSQLVYTRYLDGHFGDPNSAGIAVAKMANGAWTASPLPNAVPRATPEGTEDETDTDPRVDYIKSDKTALYWRRMSKPGTEVAIPISDMTNGNARRWVPGSHKIIFQGQPRGSTQVLVDQIFTYDTDTGALEQLTTGSGGYVGCFMWKAPEFNNEYVFMTMPKLRQSIQVFRKIAGADGVKRWTVIKTIATGATSALPYFFSPEPFVHNGRSYLMFQLSPSSKFYDKSIPTHIGLSGIDPLKNDLRVLTANGPSRLRLDPEFFITAKGPFIYYNRLVPATTTYPDGKNDGVWYVDTQLGPPKH